MIKLVDYIVDSQRNCPRVWTFTFKTPSRTLSLKRKKLLFDPYFDKKEWEAEVRRGVKSYSATNRRHIFLSIFINCNAPLIRYRYFRQSLTNYRKWLHRESRWYNFWYLRIRPWTAQILAGVTFYLIAQFGMLIGMWLLYHYKKRSWIPFINFIWSAVFKNFLIFFICSLYIFFEIFFIFLFVCVSFFLYVLVYSWAVQFVLLVIRIFFPYLVYEKGVLYSNLYHYKYGLDKSSVAVRSIFKMDWRLVGNLNVRYAKILERFETYQFPFRRQDDELYLPFLATRGVGWLRFEGPLSRVGFYSSFFPQELLSHYFRLYRWRELALPFKWVPRWGYGVRYRGVENDYFYAKNIILYSKFTEQLRFKSHKRFYDDLVICFINASYLLNKAKVVVPFTVRPYPWWFYRSNYLAISFVKNSMFRVFSWIKNVAPFRGDVFKLKWARGARRRRRRQDFDFIYPFTYAFFLVRPGIKHWLLFNGASKIFLRNRLVFNSRWLRLKLFWNSLCWRMLYPVRLLIRRVNVFKVVIFCFVVQYVTFSYPGVVAVILAAINFF